MNNHKATTEQTVPVQTVPQKSYQFFNLVMAFVSLIYVIHSSIWWDLNLDPDDSFRIAVTSDAPNISFQNHGAHANRDSFVFRRLGSLKREKLTLYQPSGPGYYKPSDAMVDLSQKGDRQKTHTIGDGHIRVTKKNGISTYRQSLDIHMGTCLEREYSIYSYDGRDVQNVVRIRFHTSLFGFMFVAWLLGAGILFYFNRPSRLTERET